VIALGYAICTTGSPCSAISVGITCRGDGPYPCMIETTSSNEVGGILVAPGLVLALQRTMLFISNGLLAIPILATNSKNTLGVLEYSVIP